MPRLSGPWLRRLILVAWPVGLAAAGVVLYLCYLALSRTEEVTSDGASIALQAWDMLHGNPLLRGWTVTDVIVLHHRAARVHDRGVRSAG